VYQYTNDDRFWALALAVYVAGMKVIVLIQPK